MDRGALRCRLHHSANRPVVRSCRDGVALEYRSFIHNVTRNVPRDENRVHAFDLRGMVGHFGCVERATIKVIEKDSDICRLENELVSRSDER